MTTQNNDRPPLTTITESGIYRLRITPPKLEKVKSWEDGTVSARLFFLAADGKCLSKNYSTKYGKALAMLVGKITGKYTAEPRISLLPAEFIDFVKPACGIYADISVEVTPDGVDFRGEPRLKYKLSFSNGTVKPAAPIAPTETASGEALPF